MEFALSMCLIFRKQRSCFNICLRNVNLFVFLNFFKVSAVIGAVYQPSCSVGCLVRKEQNGF